jgi:hypothetical protein
VVQTDGYLGFRLGIITDEIIGAKTQEYPDKSTVVQTDGFTDKNGRTQNHV